MMRRHVRKYFIPAGIVSLLGAGMLAACSKQESAASLTSVQSATANPRLDDHTSVALQRVPTAAPTPPAAAEAVSPTSGSAAESEPQGGSSIATAQTQDVLPGAMLVRTGQASVQVDSLEVGIARVRDVARRTGAVVANTSMQGGKDQLRSASIELRIPSVRFDEAVDGLSPIGKLESVNVSVEDVGEEYVDVQARMENARRLEQRLLQLLATRAGKLSDVLNVEHELARVREEIERYEGRLRYLRTRASVSTLTVNVHEPPPLVATRPGEHPIREAFVHAWRNLVGVTAALIASLGVLLPLGVLAGVLFAVGRRLLPSRASGAPDSAGEGA